MFRMAKSGVHMLRTVATLLWIACFDHQWWCFFVALASVLQGALLIGHGVACTAICMHVHGSEPTGTPYWRAVLSLATKGCQECGCLWTATSRARHPKQGSGACRLLGFMFDLGVSAVVSLCLSLYLCCTRVCVLDVVLPQVVVVCPVASVAESILRHHIIVTMTSCDPCWPSSASLISGLDFLARACHTKHFCSLVLCGSEWLACRQADMLTAQQRWCVASSCWPPSHGVITL